MPPTCLPILYDTFTIGQAKHFWGFRWSGNANWVGVLWQEGFARSFLWDRVTFQLKDKEICLEFKKQKYHLNSKRI